MVSPPTIQDCGSFVAEWYVAVVRKTVIMPKVSIFCNCKQHGATNERKDYGTDLYQSGRLLHSRLTLNDDTVYEIGVYGRMNERFLKEHRLGTYTNLVLSGKLWKHLSNIDTTCNERMDFLIAAMVKQEGVTESLKASDQMEWVGRMNNIRNRAEEFILRELVYA